MDLILNLVSLMAVAILGWGIVCLFRKGRRWRGVLFIFGAGVLGAASEDIENFTLLIIIIALVLLIWGLIWLFKARRRQSAGLMLGASLACFVSLGVMMGIIELQRAEARGYIDHADQAWAEKEGYQSSYEWKFVREHFQTLQRVELALADETTNLTQDQISALENEAELATQAIAAREEIRQVRLAALAANKADLERRIAERDAKVAEAERTEAARRQAAADARRAAELEEERELAAAQETAAADNRRRGFHCLSQWDGSHRELARAVIDSLNDPRSFQHVDTLTTNMREDGTNGILMKFRARNGFGALVLNHVQATIRNSDCAILEWTLQ